MKVLLVGNPTAAGGKAAGWIPVAKRALIDAGATVDCLLTSAQGTAAHVASRCTRFDRVVALGGDGTVREVAKAGSFKIRFSHPLRSQVDGDPGPTGMRFAVEVQPRSVCVLSGQKQNRRAT